MQRGRLWLELWTYQSPSIQPCMLEDSDTSVKRDTANLQSVTFLTDLPRTALQYSGEHRFFSKAMVIPSCQAAKLSKRVTGDVRELCQLAAWHNLIPEWSCSEYFILCFKFIQSVKDKYAFFIGTLHLHFLET